MTILEIAGKQVEVHDDFMKLSPEDQQQTVNDIASKIGGSAPSAEPEDKSGRPVGVSFLRGIPLAGAYADKATAALNAAAQPAIETGLSHAPTFSERYAENLPRVTRSTNQFEAQHPIESSVDQLLGGTAAFAPLGASTTAARALGFSGPLRQMVTRGAISNAGIGAADEALRGGSPVRGAEIGAVTGAAFPIAGRAIGTAVRALRPGERPGLPTENIAGHEIPQFESARTGDNLAGTQEQKALTGVLGPDAQRIAQEAFDARAAKTETARQGLGDQMAPATDPRLGNEPGKSPTPYQAGDQVITELAQRNNDAIREAAERDAAGIAAQTSSREAIAPGMPSTANDAMDILGESLRTGARTAANARTEAYRSAGETPGQFSPAAFDRISTSLENRLNSGAPETRVRVSDLTPRTREALATIEAEIGSGRRPTNEIDPRTRNYNDALAGGVQLRPAPPITGRDLEAVRQQLVPLMRDANNAARAPGGSAADARGMRRLMDAFDQHIRDSVQAGAFSGDGPALLRAYEQARQLHGAYRGTYSARGGGDIVGPIMEQIIGKHPGQQMTKETLAQSLFGSEQGTGGNKQVALAQRIMGIVGHDSNEGRAIKQGLLSHIMDTPQGSAPLALEKQAERIRQLVNSKGNSLAQVIFTPEERQRLLDHATLLDRLSTPGREPSAIERTVQKLAGADGREPASGRQLIDAMMSEGGKPKGDADAIANHLKDVLSPESWDSLRQGIYHHLTTAPEHVMDWGPQKISERLGKFLNDPLAKALYSPKELQMLTMLQKEYQKQIPLPGTTNPSGSGILLGKMINAAKGNLLPMLGLAVHGPGGVLAGYAGNKALSFVGNRRAVNQTKNLFQGKALKGAPSANFERAAALLAHAAVPLSTGQ